MIRPGERPLYTERTARVVAARRLTRRTTRTERGEFLAEGPQALTEALGQPDAARRVRELFGTDEALARHAGLAERAEALGVPVSRVTARGMAGLSETVNPQGLVAVCAALDVPLADALAGPPRLVAVLVDVRDPGNAGTVLRSADAAGAGVVVFAGDSVDPYNGKCVRASVGSLFHLAVVRGATLVDTVEAARAVGLRIFAASGTGRHDVFDLADSGELAGATAWVFGNEARGLPGTDAALADRAVRVPMPGRAESLNLAAAAAVCLFTSARAHRSAQR